MAKENKPKVFGIGFHKTGTTSLHSALDILGYSVTGPNGVFDPDISRNVYAMAYDLVPQYDAFVDNPWPVLFRALDKKYPGSQFILTIRPAKEWITSATRFFGTKSTPMRTWIYGAGAPKGNEERYLECYKRHNKNVLEHFTGREDDLLVLKITEGHNWNQLCPFLGESIPKIAFPHRNKAS